jgi:hypothetical protein
MVISIERIHEYISSHNHWRGRSGEREGLDQNIVSRNGFYRIKSPDSYV